MKSHNLCEGGRALGIAIGTLLITILFLVSSSMAQIPPPSSGGGSGGGGINGSVAYGPFTWNASNFPGFWHEDGISSETLSVNQQDLGGNQRVIYKSNLVYTTTTRVVPYKVYTETGLKVEYGLDASGFTGTSGGYYAKVGWLGKPYVAVNGKPNKLSELVMEQNATESKNMIIYENWDLGDGYNLTLMDLDTNARLAKIRLDNETGQLDDKVVSEGGVYTYYANGITGESAVPIFVTYVDNISENSIRLKYTWLISNKVTKFNAGDQFGIFKVDSENPLILKSDSLLSLSRGTTINILGNISLVVNDTPSLEYYPMMSGELPLQPLPVHNLNTGENFSTIQSAIDDSDTLAGHTITVNAGTYFENLNVNKQLILRGIAMPVVDARGSGSAITLSADGITLEGFTATGGSFFGEAGIKIISNYNMLSDNNASKNGEGIYLDSSSSNMLNGNNISNNGIGIYSYYSNNNTLNGNNANSNNGDGIYFQYSNNNTVSGNNASSNPVFGIYLSSSSNNTLSGNNVRSNNKYGILLEFSSNNTLSGNNVRSNNEYGILLEFSSNYNTIYNNYFSNTNNAFDDGNNIWNIPKTPGANIINGAFLGGNFWSDYAGIDTDGDGLGDTLLPYTSSGGITNGGDFLPLTAPIPFAVNININGIPEIGHTTSKILNVEFTNFNSGDPYNISITAPNGTRVYYDSGTLTGAKPEVIPINWIPSSTGNHTIEAWGRGMIDSTTVYVYDSEVVPPVPELGTIFLVTAGILGLIGIRRRY